MDKMLERLKKVTKDCRDNMHEPDEQDLDAVVSGYLFDNAMGDDPMNNYGEMTVGIRNNNGDGLGATIEWFNLASLIALARKAQL